MVHDGKYFTLTMFVLWFSIQRKIEMTAHIQIVHGVKMPYLCLFYDSEFNEKFY